jgi:hypothetical protein
MEAGPSMVRHSTYAKVYAPSAESAPPAASTGVPAAAPVARAAKPATMSARPTFDAHQCHAAARRLCSGKPVKRGITW